MASIRRGFRFIATAVCLALAVGFTFAAGSLVDPRPADARPALRVVGGEKAPPGRHPWMVALTDRRNAGTAESVFCGGSLVDPFWVITASHCVRGMSKRNIVVFVGVERPSEGLTRGIPVRAVRRPAVAGSDIAILQLAFRSRKTPLVLSDREPAPGSVGTALGWGALTAGGGTVGRLRQVEVEVRGLEDCHGVYFGAFDPESMLCAGSAGRDTCSGDSGGPLLFEGRLVGITSFGLGCGSHPGVYERVDVLARWIEGLSGPQPLRRPVAAKARATGGKKRSHSQDRRVRQLIGAGANAEVGRTAALRRR